MRIRAIYMSKGIASICLLCFLVLQYGKLASYWECQLSAESTAAYCECEKLLLDSHNKGNTESAPTAIAKEKTEECYLWEVTEINTAQQLAYHTPSSIYPGCKQGDFLHNIFQPPKA